MSQFKNKNRQNLRTFQMSSIYIWRLHVVILEQLATAMHTSGTVLLSTCETENLLYHLRFHLLTSCRVVPCRCLSIEAGRRATHQVQARRIRQDLLPWHRVQRRQMHVCPRACQRCPRACQRWTAVSSSADVVSFCQSRTYVPLSLRNISYEMRLKECGLTTLEIKRLRGDQIEVF